MPKSKVKICCISSVEEAKLAIKYGASALGLVSVMPSGPGPISEELITEIVKHIPDGIASFLLTSKQDADSIIAQQRKTKANTIQLVDSVSVEVYHTLRKELPGISIVQVIHVINESSVDEAKSVAPFVDMILLDSGNPKLAVKELGGTGRKHNWNVSRKIVETIHKPVFLAGGLNSENVREAIDYVQPYGLDVCSGVRTNGKLDEDKLKRYFDVINIV
ncbi:MAG TPA: N-(5'-phosphoribosyl)anthranilate isomerase [Bacteroidetes bacterium]|nr:N-(5'-phosphoribosyl)anthranilate isomerase [Bacteroidota bacterium]